MIGMCAGFCNNSSHNVFLGTCAGKTVTGNYNIILGDGMKAGSNSGSYNIFFRSRTSTTK